MPPDKLYTSGYLVHILVCILLSMISEVEEREHKNITKREEEEEVNLHITYHTFILNQPIDSSNHLKLLDSAIRNLDFIPIIYLLGNDIFVNIMRFTGRRVRIFEQCEG